MLSAALVQLQTLYTTVGFSRANCAENNDGLQTVFTASKDLQVCFIVMGDLFYDDYTYCNDRVCFTCLLPYTQIRQRKPGFEFFTLGLNRLLFWIFLVNAFSTYEIIQPALQLIQPVNQNQKRTRRFMSYILIYEIL